jgi:hypothetical protein
MTAVLPLQKYTPFMHRGKREGRDASRERKGPSNDGTKLATVDPERTTCEINVKLK